jgi:DME family drug/metabolite transporter
MSVVSATLRARSGVFAISGGAVLWGTTGVVAHAVHSRTGLPATSIAFYRMLTAAVVLAALRAPAVVRLAAGRRRLGALTLAGAALGASQALYFVSVAEAGVTLATLICIGAAPVVVTGASAVARRRRPPAGSVAVLGCALGGLALISTAPNSAPGAHPAAGVLAALGSGATYAASTVCSARLAGTADPLTLTGATSIVGSLTLLPAALVSGAGFAVRGVPVAALSYLGVVTTVVAYGLFYAGLRTTSAEVAAVLTLLEPLGATVLAVVLLGEALSPAGVAGAVLLLLAVGVLMAHRPETPVESAAPMG